MTRRSLLLAFLLLACLAVPGALASRDRKPPTQPGNFHVTSYTASSIATAWTASTDNIGVYGYALYSNGTKVASVSAATLAYTFSSLSCGTSYSLAAAAFDTAGNYSTQVQLAQATAACSAPPVSTGPPVVSGTAQQGQTLTTTNGSWSGTTPMTFGYQWLRCDSSGANCTAISGATSSSYTLQAADVTFTLRSRVTATNSVGSAAAVSAATTVTTAPAAIDLSPLCSSGNCDSAFASMQPGYSYYLPRVGKIIFLPGSSQS